MAEAILDGVPRTPQSTTLLSDVANEIEDSVPEDMRQHYDSIINACSDLLWGEDTYSIVGESLDKEIKKVKDIPSVVADDIASAVGIVIQKSGQPVEDLAEPAMIACQILMLHVLEYIQKKRGFKIDEKILAQTSHETTKKMLKLFGITKQQFQASMQQLQERAADHEESRLNAEEEGVIPFEEGQELPVDEFGQPVEGEAVPPEAAPEAAPAEATLPIAEGAV